MYHVKIFWIDGLITESVETPNPKEALDFAEIKVTHDRRVIRRIEVHDLGGSVRTVFCAQEAA